METCLHYLCYNIRIYCTRALRSLIQETTYNIIRIVLHGHGHGMGDVKVDLVMFYTLCLYSACYEYDTGSLK